MTAPGKKRYDDLAAERHWREWSLRGVTSFVSHHRDEDGRLTTAIARTAKEIKEAKSKSHNKYAAKDAIAFKFWKSLAGGGQVLSLSPMFSFVAVCLHTLSRRQFLFIFLSKNFELICLSIYTFIHLPISFCPSLSLSLFVSVSLSLARSLLRVDH